MRGNRPQFETPFLRSGDFGQKGFSLTAWARLSENFSDVPMPFLSNVTISALSTWPGMNGGQIAAALRNEHLLRVAHEKLQVIPLVLNRHLVEHRDFHSGRHAGTYRNR
jgi:hypothetical protein